ncbi:hypothetical protein [Streptomyces buecherae]|uniref:hypothetical protein n=1 Tax=Streptomyces buecherae TaxID=2763006 RepID=UPI0037A7D15F
MTTPTPAPTPAPSPASFSGAASATEIERATHDLHDALARLEALGRSPFPVGDPTGRAHTPLIAGGELAIILGGRGLAGEALVWTADADGSGHGQWSRQPYTHHAPHRW